MKLVTPPASLYKLYALSADVQWARFKRLIRGDRTFRVKNGGRRAQSRLQQGFSPRRVSRDRCICKSLIYRHFP